MKNSVLLPIMITLLIVNFAGWFSGYLLASVQIQENCANHGEHDAGKVIIKCTVKEK